MNNILEEKIQAFYQDIEVLSNCHAEVGDSDVRESLHMVLTYYFVWGLESKEMPTAYGMYTISGDEEVSSLVNNFLAVLLPLLQKNQIEIGQRRLDLLQNPKLVTSNGMQYDELIGHSDHPLLDKVLPSDFFEPGIYE